MTNKAALKKFGAVIWEKAEHWTFETTVQAADERDAYAKLMKEFPSKRYTVRQVYHA